MKKGKILTNPLIRSVLRSPFPQHEEQALSRDGAVLYDGGNVLPADGAGISVNTTVYGGEGAEAIAFYRAFNNALAAGILPEKLTLLLTLPASETEEKLAERMRMFKALAEREKTVISGGHTTVSDHVSAPVLSAVITGGFDAGYAAGKHPAPGDDLIMTGYAGECGAALLERAHHEEFSRRFAESFLSGVYLEPERLSVSKAADILRGEGACMHDVSEGGVFSALYTFAEGHACGFTAELKAVPIRQETVEICSRLDVNPYELLSTGAMIASVKDAEAVLAKLAEAGIPAARIGEITAGSRKILIRKEGQQCLERPVQDPVMSLTDFG